MFTLDTTRRILLATGTTDLRRGYNGLYALIQEQLRGDPLSGTIYVFCNRRRDALKLLCYDEGGLWVCGKRLEQGTFRWPSAGEQTVALTAAELQLLLSGIDLTFTQRRAWWQRPSTGTPPPVHASQSGPVVARDRVRVTVCA